MVHLRSLARHARAKSSGGLAMQLRWVWAWASVWAAACLSWLVSRSWCGHAAAGPLHWTPRVDLMPLHSAQLPELPVCICYAACSTCFVGRVSVLVCVAHVRCMWRRCLSFEEGGGGVREPDAMRVAVFASRVCLFFFSSCYIQPYCLRHACLRLCCVPVCVCVCVFW